MASFSKATDFKRCLFCLKKEFGNKSFPSSSSRTFSSNCPPNMSALCKCLKISDWQQNDEHDEQFLLCCNCSGVLEVLLGLTKNLEELQQAIEEETGKIRSFIVESGFEDDDDANKRVVDLRRVEWRFIWKFHNLVRQAAQKCPKVEAGCSQLEMKGVVDPKLPGGSMVPTVRLTRILKDDLKHYTPQVKEEKFEDNFNDDDGAALTKHDDDDDEDWTLLGGLDDEEEEDDPGGSGESHHEDPLAVEDVNMEEENQGRQGLSKDTGIKISRRNSKRKTKTQVASPPVRKHGISRGATRKRGSAGKVRKSGPPKSNSEESHENCDDVSKSSSGPSEPDPKNANFQFQCPFCNKSFKNGKRLASHIRHVHDEKVDPSSKLSEFVKPEESQTCCSICGKSFATQSTSTTYRSHMSSHTDEEISNSLGIPTSYRISSKSGKRIGTRTCNLCGKTTTHDGLPGFREHMLSHEPLEIPTPGDSTTTTTFSCSICDKRFVHSLNLELHKLYSHSLRRRPAFLFKCDQCSIYRKSREALIVHLKSHDDGGSVYSCKSCPMSYSSLNRLLHHMIKHSFSGRFPCPVCDDVVTSSLKQLSDHCVSHHDHQVSAAVTGEGSKSKPVLGKRPNLQKQERRKRVDGRFPCKICLKSFRNSFSLKSHLQLHSDPNAWKCEHCGKSYSSPVALATHVRQLHPSEEEDGEGVRFQCPHCTKTFNRKWALDNHLGQHTGVKPHVCHVCGNQFAAKHLLHRHLKVVHAEAPAVCEVCGLECRNLTKLKIHYTNVHGEKRFSCEQCPKAFSKKFNLQAHVLTHSGERPFPCHLCDKGFVRKDYLGEHVSKVHGGGEGDK